MTDRLQRLLARAQARTGRFWTRQRWWNEGMAAAADQPMVVRRARAFQHLLANVEIRIQSDEILVGWHPSSQPPAAPRAAATPPPRRDPQDDYRLPAERAALKAGVFTSANKPDHLTANYPRLLTEGADALLDRIETATHDHPPEQAVQREAMRSAVESFAAYIERHADVALRLASEAEDPRRQDDLSTIAAVCRHVAHKPPRTLREALQLAWFAFLVSCMENGPSTGAFAVGRFDQYLWPFWQADAERGISREVLVEQVGCFWVKLNEFVMHGLATGVLNMTIGGGLPDGSDGVNDLSWSSPDLKLTPSGSHY